MARPAAGAPPCKQMQVFGSGYSTWPGACTVRPPAPNLARKPRRHARRPLCRLWRRACLGKAGKVAVRSPVGAALIRARSVQAAAARGPLQSRMESRAAAAAALLSRPARRPPACAVDRRARRLPAATRRHPRPAAAPTRQRTATACTAAPACDAGPPRAPCAPGRRQGQQQDGELWRGWGSGRVGKSRGRQGGAIPPQSAACGSVTTPGATWAQAGIAVRGIGPAIKGGSKRAAVIQNAEGPAWKAGRK